jgi:hypothetical protein
MFPQLPGVHGVSPDKTKFHPPMPDRQGTGETGFGIAVGLTPFPAGAVRKTASIHDFRVSLSSHSSLSLPLCQIHLALTGEADGFPEDACGLLRRVEAH